MERTKNVERFLRTAIAAGAFIALNLTVGISSTARADETCMSPYMAKIVGQEDFVYVWTLGVEGVGDGQDKLVTVDVNPKSKTLRQGRQQPLRRRSKRGTPFGLDGRPVLPLGGGTRYQQDLHL